MQIATRIGTRLLRLGFMLHWFLVFLDIPFSYFPLVFSIFQAPFFCFCHPPWLKLCSPRGALQEKTLKKSLSSRIPWDSWGTAIHQVLFYSTPSHTCDWFCLEQYESRVTRSCWKYTASMRYSASREVSMSLSNTYYLFPLKLFLGISLMGWE